MERKKIKIGLISHFFFHENLGCSAISISNLLLIKKACENNKLNVKFYIYIPDNIKKENLDFFNIEYEYRKYPRTRKLILNFYKLFKTDMFDECDYIFNLSGGDGYCDLYGIKRLISESYILYFAWFHHKKIIFSPQTIGPFSTKIGKFISKNILNKIYKICTRDNLSIKYLQEIGLNNYNEFIDVALSLPYKKQKINSKKIKIGLNVSGLLYNNYSKFNIKIDYKIFIDKLIEHLLSKNYEVYLISHVNYETKTLEDDYSICYDLSVKYNLNICPKYNNPSDIKSYISGLDFFIGSRLHSTIAAYSSGVCVIPLSYSRKFDGLYNSLKYPYYISLSKTKDINNLIKNIDKYMNDKNKLMESIKVGTNIYNEKLNKYVEFLGDVFNEKIK